MSRYGLVGKTLGHSLSPLLHQEIFSFLKDKESMYELIEIKEKSLSNIKKIAKNYQGLNITVPYKEKVLPFLDELSPEGAETGAVNTVLFRKNRLIGYNTDVHGFLSLLNHYRINPENKKTIILGTGGASKAVACALKKKRVGDIIFVSRNSTNFGENPNKKVIDYQTLRKTEGDIIINTTPMGMWPKVQLNPIDEPKVFENFEIAIDVIYNPL